MFKRKIYQELIAWSKDPHRKPLIVRGARQVGKTTAIKQFGLNFKCFLHLNLEKKNHRNLFEGTDNPKQIIEDTALLLGIPLVPNSTLLFIDEIQNSPRAIAMLRYFYEEMPNNFVIAAGSLLESMLGEHISFPVGRVEYKSMHPCCFQEFLEATGKGLFIEAINNSRISHAIHQELINLFNRYALVGGMPEIVDRYSENNDIVALNKTYNELIVAYRGDVEKYSTRSSITQVIRMILNDGWQFSGQNIKFEHFANSAYKSREVGEAFRTLEKTMLLKLVYPVTSTTMPSIPNLRYTPKLIWLDSGLVNYCAQIQREYLFNSDLIDTWRGHAAEQIVAQELIALDYEVDKQQAYWTKPKSEAEVDFTYIYQGLIIPIEVKSGHNSHLKSIHQFINNANHDIAVRIWSGEFSVEDQKTQDGKAFRLVNLPFYMVSILPSILNKLI